MIGGGWVTRKARKTASVNAGQTVTRDRGPFWQPVVQVRLHSTGTASRLAAFASPSNIPDILGRRDALPAGRIAALGATPDLHHVWRFQEHHCQTRTVV